MAYEVTPEGLQRHEHDWVWADGHNNLLTGPSPRLLEIAPFYCARPDCPAVMWAKVRYDAERKTFVPIGQEANP